MDSDALNSLKVLLDSNREAVEKLSASTSELAKVIAKVDGKSTPDKPLDTEALVKALSEGLTSAMKPLITEMSRNAGMGGGGPPGDGGDGGGGEAGGGGGADWNQTLSSMAVAQAITGDLKELQKSTRELFSIRDSFRDARTRQIQTLESIVGSLHQSVVGLLSGAELLNSFQEQMRESRENTERGLGGMLDTWGHNFAGAVDGFGQSAQTFAGGALSFSQTVKLIAANQSLFARFDGDRQDFARQMSRSMDQVEVALRSRGESVYDFQTGEQFREMHATLVDLYGLNVQTAENAANIRRLDTPGNIRRTMQQLDFLRQTARNTGRSVEELMQMNADESLLELANKAGLDENASAILGQLNTMAGIADNPRFMENINRALEGVSTGRGLGAFSEDPEALVRGEAQAALRLVEEIRRGNGDLHSLIEDYVNSVNASNGLNIVGSSMSNRGNLRMMEGADRWRDDQMDGQNTFFERMGRMWDDFFQNNALGQMLMAGAGLFGSLVTATNANTVATLGLTLQMGARGLMGTIRNLPNMFGNMFQRVLAVLGMRRGAASLVDDGFDVLGAGRAGRTAAAGAGGLRGLLGGLGKAGGVGFILTGLLGLFDGTGSQFTDALGENGQAAFADFTSNLLKLILGGVLIAVGGIPAAIIGGVAFLLDRAFDFFNLGKLFGLSEDAGLFDAIGIGLTNLGNMLGNWFSNLPFFESITSAVGGFFGGIARFLGIMEDDVEEQAEDAEAELDRVNNQTEQNVTRIVMAANETRRVVFPENGEQRVIDLNRAAASLRNSNVNEQLGMSDADMLLALRRGGELQAEQVRVLMAIERELSAQGRSVFYNTDTTPGSGIERARNR